MAFGGSRTYHRIACAIEDAGFEIRDTIMWLYGSGFPKSMNIGLAIDKKNGVDNRTGVIRTDEKATNPDSKIYNFNDKDKQTSKFEKVFEKRIAQNRWAGWGTALKPAYEPIIVARKPLKGSCVDNVMKYGVGGINIDECRVEGEERIQFSGRSQAKTTVYNAFNQDNAHYETVSGRFPANVIHDGSEEACANMPNSKGGSGKGFKAGDYEEHDTATNFTRGDFKPYNDDGSASRYFYCAKASRKDRDEGLDEFEKQTVNNGRNTPIDNAFQQGENLRKNTHPTVKPTSLMQYLVRLVTPKGGTVLDPFMGSGSTGKAVMYENKERNAGYKFIGIELTEEYLPIAEARIKYAEGEIV